MCIKHIHKKRNIRNLVNVFVEKNRLGIAQGSEYKEDGPYMPNGKKIPL